MNQSQKEFVDSLQSDIEALEKQSQYWEDPRVLCMQDIGGSKKTGKELAEGCRGRIKELRQLIRSISK